MNLPKTANTDDANLLTWPATVVLERRVQGDTTTKHGSCLVRWDLVRDLHNEVIVCSVVVGVSTVRHGTIWERRSECANHALAVVLEAILALLAVRTQAGSVLRTNADTVADLDVLLHVLADASGLADNLVTDAACWNALLAPGSFENIMV